MKYDRLQTDLVEELRSPGLLGRLRGNEALEILRNILSSAPDDSLTVVDISSANPLQYSFCEHAFGPLFADLGESSLARKYVIIRMKDFHEASFFHGVMRHLGQHSERKASQQTFSQAGYNIKTLEPQEDTIRFVGNLPELVKDVLETVNKKGTTTLREISDMVGSSDEEVISALEDLKRRKFLIDHRDETTGNHEYVSFYRFFRGDE
jgi:hypothetical protein